MSKLTRSEQIIAEKTVCILLIRGESPEGKKIWAYVGVRADRLEAFVEAQKSGVFYPEDFGAIIQSGEGEPSEDVKAHMTKEYGFNHEAMIDLPDTDAVHDITSNLTGKTEN